MMKAQTDDKEDNGFGGLVMMLLTVGTLLGIHLLTRKSPHERLLDETEALITQEAQRLGKPIDIAHLELALRRFNEPQLRLFNRYVKAVIHRDIAAWEAMKPEWMASMAPVLRNAPEWKAYEGIIIGG